MLSDKGALPTMPIPAKTWNFKRNPLHDLPMSKYEIITGIDFVFLCHLHFDLVVSHMDGVNHNTLSRNELKEFLSEKSISSKVLVPDDGESYEF